MAHRKDVAKVKDRAGYWRANSRLIAVLLSIWAIASLGCGVLGIRWMNTWTIGQVPAGFWFAQQGAIYIFVILIFAYAILMDRIDKQYDVEE